ncbi:helix-turn-helix domain-containing protein [Streptococcus porcinus]|uniref:helix-turn-helix domain-containing protein n=1 Tax=Streptococcus porcinus TaxID=1340 RepID=UPI001960A145|nr:helix-turn-helix domain-containing protein [Streptococcus porcinus]
MLEHYLEKPIIDKKTLLTMFLDKKEFLVSELLTKTKLSYNLIKQYCQELNDQFPQNLKIEVTPQAVTTTYNEELKDHYLFDLYAQSNILQLLRFLLLNKDNQKPLTYFAERSFISNASAYRMREAIRPFLKEIGLTLNKNLIGGDEYRIRFLIALLQSKFGIIIYKFTQEDFYLINQFITNSASNLKFSNLLEHSFQFYNTLLALSWKRFDYQVCLPQSDIFTELKQIFIYQKISETVTATIEKEMHLSFSTSDVDYLFLIYILANNSFASQEWTKEEVDFYISIFEQNDNFQLLLNPLKKLFNVPQNKEKEFLRIVLAFAKDHIYQLEPFIPEKNYFLSNYCSENSLLKEAIFKIVKKWKKDIKQAVQVNTRHLNLFCNHLELFLKSYQSPLQLVFLSTDFTSSMTLTDFIANRFSSDYVCFHSYYLLTDDIYQIADINPHLIVTSHQLIPFIEQEIISGIPILDFSHNNLEANTRQLQDTIAKLKAEQFSNFLKQQIQLAET